MFFGTYVNELGFHSEIRKPESNIEKTKDKDKDNYKNIKPESDITASDAKNYIDSLFGGSTEESANESDNFNQIIESAYLEILDEAAKKDPEIKKRIEFMKLCAEYAVRYFKSRNINARYKKFELNGYNKNFINGSSKVFHIPLDKSIMSGMPKVDKVELKASYIPSASALISKNNRDKEMINTYLNNTTFIKDNINEHSKDMKALKVSRSSEVFGYKITVGTPEELEAQSNT